MDFNTRIDYLHCEKWPARRPLQASDKAAQGPNARERMRHVRSAQTGEDGGGRPRDGLQIEQQDSSTEQKLRMVNSLADAGLREIEVGSFVNPKAVPQMADTADVFAGIEKRPGVRYTALWLNPKGLERALESWPGRCRRQADADRQRDLREAQYQPQHRRDLRRDAGLDRALSRGRHHSADGLGVMAGLRLQFRGLYPGGEGRRPDRAHHAGDGRQRQHS